MAEKKNKNLLVMLVLLVLVAIAFLGMTSAPQTSEKMTSEGQVSITIQEPPVSAGEVSITVEEPESNSAS